jgi:small-conductance mechanosensitive channel
MTWLSWFEPLQRTFSDVSVQAVEFLPTILAALGLLLIGWVVGRIVRTLTQRTVEALVRRVPGRFQPTASTQGDLAPRLSHLVGTFVFWVIFIVFFGAATDVLGLPVLAAWLGGLSRFLPRLLLAAMIVLAGVLAGALAREAVAATTRAGGFGLGPMLGRWTQLAIIAAAVVTAVDQVGIDSEFVTTAFTVGLGGFLGASALAFGLGARTTVSNIIGVHHIRQIYDVGQLIRVGSTRGRIREITGTSVILETEEGREVIPGKLFSEQVSTLLMSADA